MKTLSDIDLEKQRNIINSALEEFSIYGYSNASTNRIVKRAGISKGLLFYYFQNKQELLYFLFDYAISYMMEHYVDKIDTDMVDFFERYKQQRGLKRSIYQENPYLFGFLTGYYYQFRNEMELPAELKQRLGKLESDISDKLHTNLDRDMFRQDMELSEVFTYIKWLLSGYEAELMKEVGDDLASVDWNYYFQRDTTSLDNLKKIFYKKEYY
ncbi:TetR/AcrR family transcriptional regulator [Sporosarcina sp. Te-1]|uniref:TetR/AcrR family transcriptional regulator n=1 Tax=Sporosarcina sp. Te-1 TaxID=2818390 RepID=UPI001A9E5B5C|nr:TetR/AcrR family transcriptional regulator [Sporosarcina sp. Te-1]QTD41940.1 TetR/AcrR family transcriptional regulator [Sporosarcina sp. Te-1]